MASTLNSLPLTVPIILVACIIAEHPSTAHRSDLCSCTTGSCSSAAATAAERAEPWKADPEPDRRRSGAVLLPPRPVQGSGRAPDRSRRGGGSLRGHARCCRVGEGCGECSGDRSISRSDIRRCPGSNRECRSRPCRHHRLQYHTFFKYSRIILLNK